MSVMQRTESQSKDGHTTRMTRPCLNSSQSSTRSGSRATSGGFSESGASHNHPEPYSRSHCRSNTRTVVLHPFFWGSRLPLLVIVSLCVFLLFPYLALLFSKGPRRSSPPLDIALRMIYPHNPQSHRLTCNIILIWLIRRNPFLTPFLWVFSLLRSLSSFQASFV